MVANRLSLKFDKLWVLAELILFVLVGSQVSIHIAIKAGMKGILIFFIGLVARSIGVLISTLATKLNAKEKLFCVI